MSRLYYEALKKLPKRFIDDETKVVEFGGKMIVAANPKYSPICYCDYDSKWSPVPTHIRTNDGMIPISTTTN